MGFKAVTWPSDLPCGAMLGVVARVKGLIQILLFDGRLLPGVQGGKCRVLAYIKRGQKEGHN